MSVIHSIILGIVEGITEFLPISSTFHLIWTSKLLQLQQTEFVKLFEVVIQSGAILAVVFLYWKDLLTNFTLIKKLIASFVPTAIVGYILYDVIKGVFFESLLVSTIVFILVGLVFIFVERLISAKKLSVEKDISRLSFRDALLIGLFQACAVVPGVSRSGAILVGMLLLGFRRDVSGKYSFLLAIPTIGAATVLDLIEMREILFQNNHYLIVLTIGTLVSFVSAYIGVSWLIQYLQKHSLQLFGWYRVGIGIILLIALVA